MSFVDALEPMAAPPGPGWVGEPLGVSRHAARGVARWLAVFTLGAVAQGVPFVLVAIELERRGSAPTWLAGAVVARLAPYLLVSPVAGALAARVAPALLFVMSGIARAVFAAAIGTSLVVGAPSAVPVVLLFGLVAVGCPAYPALMRIVEAHATTTARPRHASVAAGVESAAFWAGPALGGALLAVGTVGATATCMAMCFGSALLARTGACGDVTIDTGQSRGVLQGAFRRMFGPSVLPAVAAVLGLNVLGGFVTTLLVRLPADLGIAGAHEYGRLTIGLGGGALLAVVVVAAPAGFSRRPLAPLVVGGAAVTALAVAPHLLLATAACLVLGATVMVAEMVAATQISTSVPSPLIAPVVGLLDATMVAAMVAGAVAAPLAIATAGARAGLVVAGGAALLCAGVARLGRGLRPPLPRRPRGDTRPSHPEEIRS